VQTNCSQLTAYLPHTVKEAAAFIVIRVRATTFGEIGSGAKCSVTPPTYMYFSFSSDKGCLQTGLGLGAFEHSTAAKRTLQKHLRMAVEQGRRR
jgi:hypothetical protein